MRRIYSKKDCNGYTMMKSVLFNLELNNKSYTWLISDIEAYPQNDEIAKIFKGKEYIVLSTKELVEILEKEDFQWIWAVFSAIPSKHSNEEILQYDLPYIEPINKEYNPFKDTPKVQHPLAEFEICAWDSSGMFLVSDDENLINKFKKCYPKSYEDIFELRIKDNLKINEEHDQVALKAKLVCRCGCEKFKLFHTGKQTKGIFFPHLVKKNKQIEIVAHCECCGHKITILDTKIDGSKPLVADKNVLAQFKLKDLDVFNIEVAYKYYVDDYMTNKFVECFIFIRNDKGKEVVLYEG